MTFHDGEGILEPAELRRLIASAIDDSLASKEAEYRITEVGNRVHLFIGDADYEIICNSIRDPSLKRVDND